MNEKDPLLKASADNTRELFTRFAQQSHGFATEDVIGAAINLLVNSIRQTYSTREKAEKHYDELMGRTKSILLDHYDHVGRKNGVFPFTQTINATMVDMRPKKWV